MSNGTLSLVENLCRTCMGEEESEYLKTNERQRAKVLFSIFIQPPDLNSANTTIMEILKEAIPKLSIETDDLLPKNICQFCLDKVVALYRFRQRCLNAEHKLKELIDENDLQQNVLRDNDDPLSNSRLPSSFTDLNIIMKIELDETLLDQNHDANFNNAVFSKKEASRNDSKVSDDGKQEWERKEMCTEELTARKENVAEKSTQKGPEENIQQDLLRKLNPSVFTCNQCGSRFKTNKSLKRHENAHQLNDSSNKVLRKRNKAIQYIDDDSYDKKQHLKSKNVEDKNNKNIGDIQNVTKNSIPCIQEETIKDKQHICHQCNNHFKTRQSLERHQKIHLSTSSSSKKQFKSDEEYDNDSHITNDVDFSELQNNKIRGSLPDDEVPAEIEKGTKDLQSLNPKSPEHITEDNGEKPYACDECGSLLKNRKNLKRHKKIHLRLPTVKAERPKKIFVCELCQKVFSAPRSLKEHLRVHSGEQPYLCPHCGKAFTRIANMREHLLRHGEARRYECPDCPKKFQCHSDLSCHRAVHTKPKTLVCDICGAGFFKPYQLKQHKWYHTGEKKHKCDYCDMRFVMGHHCRRHMRTHTGEKPYKCKYCVRAFAQSNDLIKHLRSHLGDNVYRCDLCPKDFRLLGEMRAHFNTHKNDDDETRQRNLQALKEEELRLQLKFSTVTAADNP